MKYKFFFILLLVSVAAASANAQITHKHHFRSQTQIGSGISPSEAFRLRHIKQDLRKDYVRAKMNDGRIGPLERRHLQRERKQIRRAQLRFKANGRL